MEMYAAVRMGGGDPAACAAFRGERDELFATHPASPLPEAQRARFGGLPYFPHRPDLRVEAELEPDPDPAELVLPISTGDPARFTRIGFVHLAVGGERGLPGRLLARGLRRRALPALPRRPRRRARPTAAGATCSTRSRAPTSAPVTAAASCSTSTTPTTPRAPTTPGGAAPLRHPRTACWWPWRPASGWHRGPERRSRVRSGHRVARLRTRDHEGGRPCSRRSGCSTPRRSSRSSRCSSR